MGEIVVESEVRSFGALLRELRLTAGLSRDELAERAGLSAKAVAALERGERASPRPTTIRLLADALHVAPSVRAELVRGAAGSAVAASRRPVAPRMCLPIPPLPLIGRAADVARARAVLAADTGHARLVTLIGPGGVGKTRLALEIGFELGPQYRDGAVFVDLAPVRDPHLVPATIARALGVSEVARRSTQEVLQRWLAERQLLLLLDNLEQVLGAAPLLAELAASCPELTMLVTSRSPLRLRGERRLAVAPLEAPDPTQPLAAIAATPAVQLFVARAQAVRPEFALSAHNAAEVARICGHLDGLPLAIELAAAQVGVLPPRALLSRLEHRVTDLGRGAVDLPARQRTLRDTLAWSYDLLRPAEQVLLRRLSIFAGGFTLNAAEAVSIDAEPRVDAVLDCFQGLLDSSLVRRSDKPASDPLGDSAAQPRFSLLEIVREFALERLAASGEAEVVRARHAAYWLQEATRVVDVLKTTGSTDEIRRLGHERDNLHAALDWLACLADRQAALGLATAAAWVWAAEGHVAEERARFDRLLAAHPRRTPARASALLSAAMLAWVQGDYLVQEQLARESLDIARAQPHTDAIAEALSTLGAAAFQRGEHETARHLLAESLDLFRQLRQRLGIGWSLMRLASVARDQSRFVEAEQLYEEALALRRSAGDPSGVAHILSNLSWLALYAGAYARARALQAESLAIRRELDERREMAVSLVVLARIALAQGTPDAAWAPLAEGMDLCREVGDRWAIALALEVRAGLLAAAQPARALRLAGAAAVLREATGRPVPPPERPLVEAVLAPARRVLGETAAAAWAAGASLTPEAAMAEAVAVDVSSSD